MKKVFWLLVISIFAFSCGEGDEETCAFVPDAKEVNVELRSYEDSLVNIPSKKALIAFLTRKPVMRDFVFKRGEYPNDSTFVREVFNKLNNPHFDTLLSETNRVFGNREQLKKQFEEAFANLRYYYPNVKIPRIETVITGFDTDLFVSDSLIVLGLDYFLGRGAKYRPKQYEYVLRQYNPENIVPSCMLIYGISDRFNKTDLNDKTVLADMMAYGKSFYFAKHMLPCTPDSTFIWYTAEEIRGSKKNQDLIWARLIQDNVLYATGHMVKQKYLGERPKTLEVGEDCPGRIAQFVGWQIVNAYMNNHREVTLPELMKQSNAQKIFKDSGYKPERK